jgi:hypothetical protein
MKSFPSLFLVPILGGISVGYGETEPPAASRPPAATARSYIPHPLEVPAFVPPAPPVVKEIPAMRIDSSVTVPTKSAKTLTILRGEASTQPDLPPPPPAPPHVELRDPTPEEIAQRIWHHRHNFNFGATVYDHKVSVINWTDQESLVRYEAVCGFDIGLLAGIGSFIHHGEDYSFFLLHSHIDTTWEQRLTRSWKLPIPMVEPGQIRITKGDVEDTTATAPMTIIKEIIAAEMPRLLAYQAQRKTYSAASAAWHAANPPIPRDETFILRPHRGSRYLSNPRPKATTR